jgi:1,4-dihydroxy-2-naphthoyl-CoA hydrolase
MDPEVLEQLNSWVQGFDRHYGLEYVRYSEQELCARVLVTPEIRQPLGLVHGGVYAAVAESMASLGTVFLLRSEESVVLGMSNNTSFLRPISEGYINGRARPLHRGHGTWLWDVEISDDEGRLCAVTRMTIAVRPRRTPAPPV